MNKEHNMDYTDQECRRKHYYEENYNFYRKMKTEYANLVEVKMEKHRGHAICNVSWEDKRCEVTKVKFAFTDDGKVLEYDEQFRGIKEFSLLLEERAKVAAAKLQYEDPEKENVYLASITKGKLFQFCCEAAVKDGPFTMYLSNGHLGTVRVIHMCHAAPMDKDDEATDFYEIMSTAMAMKVGKK